MSKVCVNDILTKIQAVAQKKGIRLTYTNMRVYLKLVEYAEENKDTDTVVNYLNSVRFNITTAGFAEYCSVAPRMVTDTLNKLKECGVIKYTTNAPNPSVVMLMKRYYE